ncbi:MAG: prepilin-type N-terminal cleavage/methylation domain-containing protein [Candidatus Neomarinimicrobiota bacterium]
MIAPLAIAASDRRQQSGMTLIEVVIVIIIVGIIAGISMRSITRINENANFNETIAELDIVAEAIVGNPDIIQNNIRIDFGYVGDTGVMPATLDDLYSNVSGVTSWNGPYIELGFGDDPDHFKRDAWGNFYIYHLPTNPGEKPYLDTQADGDTITRDIAGSVNSLLSNTIRIRPYDVDSNMINGTNGVVHVRYSGSWHNMPYNTTDKYFESNTVPIGLRQVRVISAGDTVYKSISITPGTSMRVPEQLTVYPEYGTITYVAASYSLTGTNNNILGFNVLNSGSPTYNVTRVLIELEGLTNDCLDCKDPFLAQFSTLWAWNTFGRTALVPNGAWITLDSPLRIYTGTKSITAIEFEDASDGSGNPVNLQGLRINVEFNPSTGPKQRITFTTTGSCLPASIANVGGTTVYAAGILSFTLRNSGTLPVQINSMTANVPVNTDNIYMENVQMPASTIVWSPACSGGSRVQIRGVTNSVTFCSNTPVTITGGGGTRTAALSLYTSAVNTVRPVLDPGVNFNLTFMVECGSAQNVTLTP